MSPIQLPGRLGAMRVEDATAELGRYWSDNSAVWDLFEAPLTECRDQFKPLDVLALNALNARMTMADMTAFWSSKERQGWEDLLARVPQTPLEGLEPAGLDAAAGSLAAVANEISKVRGWGGGTRVGKLLYRMRPGLAPIWDQYVGSYYSKEDRKSWETWYPVAMRQILDNAAPLRAAITGTEQRISIVRAWDILLWQAEARRH